MLCSVRCCFAEHIFKSKTSERKPSELSSPERWKRIRWTRSNIMENVVKEDVLQALNEFDVKNDIPIPSLLEEYLNFVASTGDTVFPWNIIKVLVRRKIEQVLCDFLITSSPESVPVSPNVDPFKYALIKEKILEALEYFTQAPFTIQRLCEVMVDPKRYYKRIDKLMRAMEKNLLVTTTTEPRRPSSPNAHMSGVINGYEDRTNGHHLEEQEDEPMDITAPAVLSQPIIGQFIDGPMNVKTSEDDEDGIENIDVDQAPDVISSQTHSFDITMVEVHQGESSQENLLQIQLQMREQQQRQLIIVNVDDQAAVAADDSSSSSSSQSSGKTESVEADASRSNENSCSDDTTSDVEQGDTRESQLDTELEQQVPQFVLCESRHPGTSPVQFQSVSSQTQETTKLTGTGQQPLSSSALKTEDTSAGFDGTTDQISVVESSQNDSIHRSNESAATSAAAATDDAASQSRLSSEESSTSPRTVTTTAMTTTTATTTAAAATATTTTAAAAAATTTTTTTTTTITTIPAISLDQRMEDDGSCSTLLIGQQSSAARNSDEAELSTTGSPENEAAAKE